MYNNVSRHSIYKLLIVLPEMPCFLLIVILLTTFYSLKVFISCFFTLIHSYIPRHIFSAAPFAKTHNAPLIIFYLKTLSAIFDLTFKN